MKTLVTLLLITAFAPGAFASRYVCSKPSKNVKMARLSLTKKMARLKQNSWSNPTLTGTKGSVVICGLIASNRS